MGPSLSGIEDLVGLPTGCGEQNMVKLAPNIAVLQYLMATNQLSPDLEAKIQDHLYQGELCCIRITCLCYILQFFTAVKMIVFR